MKHFVYIHTAPSGHQYVGIHSGNNVYERWGVDGIRYKGQVFYNAIEEYTWDNIYHDWWEVPSRRHAEAEEQYLIKALDSKNNGYNCTDGGEGTLGGHWSLSEETKVKMRKPKPDVTRAKISASLSGENNPMYGRRGEDNPNYGSCRTDSQKVNMRKPHPSICGESNPNYGGMSEEAKEHMRHPKSEEGRANIAKAQRARDHSGENNPMHGKSHLEESRVKMSKNKKWYRNKITGHVTTASVVTRMINNNNTTEDQWELVENN